MKWQKQHIQTETFSSFDQDKNALAALLENPKLAALTMWTLFEKVVSPLIELLLHKTDQYANRDKKTAMWNHRRRRNKNKKSKINVKWQKQHIQTETFSSFDQDKNALAALLENPKLAALTMWTLFEKVVSPLIELLLHKTDQYANRDKNKPQFKVTLEELKNFIGPVFLLGYNIRLAEQDYWSVDPDLRCDTFEIVSSCHGQPIFA